MAVLRTFATLIALPTAKGLRLSAVVQSRVALHHHGAPSTNVAVARTRRLPVAVIEDRTGQFAGGTRKDVVDFYLRSETWKPLMEALERCDEIINKAKIISKSNDKNVGESQKRTHDEMIKQEDARQPVPQATRDDGDLAGFLDRESKEQTEESRKEAWSGAHALSDKDVFKGLETARLMGWKAVVHERNGLNSTRPIANGKENGNIHEIGTQFSIACRWYGIAARRLADLEKCVLVSPILVSRAEVDDLRSLRRLLCERMQGARKSRESMTNYAAAKEHGDESKMDLVRQGLRMRLDKAFGDHNLLHLE